MTIERRNYHRVRTHIPSKLIDANSAINHPGYLENITMEGVGIVSPGYLPPKAQIICQFSLQENTPPLRIPGSLVYIRQDLGSFYYYGIKFNAVHPEHRRIIADYLESLSGPRVPW